MLANLRNINSYEKISRQQLESIFSESIFLKGTSKFVFKARKEIGVLARQKADYYHKMLGMNGMTVEKYFSDVKKT